MDTTYAENDSQAVAAAVTHLKFWPASDGIHVVEVSSAGDVRLVGWLWIAA